MIARLIDARRVELLKDARAMLAQMQRLHCASHDLGRAEQAGVSEIFTDKIGFSRQLIESADRLCAEISKHLGDKRDEVLTSENNKPNSNQSPAV